MLFKIILKNGDTRIIKANSLDDAEKKAPKKWVDIYILDSKEKK